MLLVTSRSLARASFNADKPFSHFLGSSSWGSKEIENQRVKAVLVPYPLCSSCTYINAHQRDQFLGEFLVILSGSTHQQVLDQGQSVAALLAGVLKEHFGESVHVHVVAGEVGAHGQVGVGGAHLHLDLIAYRSYTRVVHLHPVVGHIVGAGAWPLKGRLIRTAIVVRRHKHTKQSTGGIFRNGGVWY